MPKKAADPPFEQALEELEAVVEQMERGDLTLEQSLALYERGVGLSARCQKALDEAEQKVSVLSGKGQNAELEPYAGVESAEAGEDDTAAPRQAPRD